MKQTIEIEVPEGKKAIWNNNKIKFVDSEPYWKSIKTFKDAARYIQSNHLCKDLINEYNACKSKSYSEKVCQLRIVIAALTNNEERHLTTGDRWFPTIEFCRPDKKKNCYGNIVVGSIRSEGEEYLVVGGGADGGTAAGLGGFCSDAGVSGAWAYVGFWSVSSKEIAEHISKYFGKLLFEVQYEGVNCNWEWVS